jgi:hypothetical protein
MERKYSELFNITPPGSDDAFTRKVLQKANNRTAFKPIYMLTAAIAIIVVATISTAVAFGGRNTVAELPEAVESTAEADENNGEVFVFPEVSIDGVSFESYDSPFHPEFLMIIAQLTNYHDSQLIIAENIFTLTKQSGDTWRIIPFVKEHEFTEYRQSLKNFQSSLFALTPDMLYFPLSNGNYRIVTEITSSGEKHTVWADFIIDSDADKQEVFYIPDEWYGNFDGMEMTLDDVRSLAAKGDELLLSDLLVFKYLNLSSDTNYYHNWFFIDDDYSLVVHAAVGAEYPSSVILRRIPVDINAATIDIRHDDVDMFIQNKPEPVYIFPVDMDVAYINEDGGYLDETRLDFTAPRGAEIYAVADGVVVFADWKTGGYGFTVKIVHDTGLITLYAHCSELSVSDGDTVTQGQVIALVGDSGMTTHTRLHFELLSANNNALNPQTIFNLT